MIDKILSRHHKRKMVNLFIAKVADGCLSDSCVLECCCMLKKQLYSQDMRRENAQHDLCSSPLPDPLL